MDDGFPIPLLLLILVVAVPVGIVIWWIRLSARTRKIIGLSLLGIVLVIGVTANGYLLSNPPQKLTAYYQEHQYTYDGFPHTMTDSNALRADLMALNLAVFFGALIPLLLSGVLFQKRAEAETPASPFGMTINQTAQALSKCLIAHRPAAVQRVLKYYQKTKLLGRLQLSPSAFADYTGSAQESPLGLYSTIKKWSNSPTRDISMLVASLKYTTALDDEESLTQAVKDINLRFVTEFLELASGEVKAIIQKSAFPTLSLHAHDVATLLFIEISAWTPYQQAISNALLIGLGQMDAPPGFSFPRAAVPVYSRSPN
jgi:hypothetical protein